MNKLLIIAFFMFSCLAMAQDVIMQNGGTFNRCSGTFYDSGGATGDYGINENLEITLCPDIPGQKLQLNFTDFNTQSGVDIMTVFDGDSSSANVIGYFYGPNLPGIIRASPSNSSGCLTIQFNSNASVLATGWVANIQCFEPCQSISAQLDSASPLPNVDNIIKVCPNQNITLEGSGLFSDDGTGATYEWDLGDGRIISGQSATFFFTVPGVYIANLNIRDTNSTVDPLGCPNTNFINQVIQVSTEPDFAGTEAVGSTICFGDSTTIEGIVTPISFTIDCTPPVGSETFLPDGTGVSYESTLNVECYGASQTLTDIGQLQSICLNIEHSYLADLSMDIISPNGKIVRILNEDPTLVLTANLGIPWATGVFDNESNNTTPGKGSQYCFVPGNLFPTLENGILMGGEFVSGDGPGTYFDSYVPPGSYSSDNPLDGLVGSLLNGLWTIRITDNFSGDNGYIFSWKLNFDPSIQPADLSFTPTIVSESWDDDPSITNTIGNTITVQPTASGTHCYTYRALDDFGCEYTEQVCIDVLPEIVTTTPIDLFACNIGPPFLFNLTENTPVVIANSAIPSDLVVTYHNSLGGAISDVNSITTPSSFSGTDGQIIYVRIEYRNSGCYKIETFSLGLTDPPIINPVSDMKTCDDSSNDGKEAFDLESQTLTILGAQASSDFNVKYYTSLADAESGGANALTSPFTSTVNPQPIYVRVERANETSCFSTSGAPLFNLIVDYRAIANQPSSYEICDDLTNDGIEQFDLTTKNTEILGSQDPTLFTISYYENPTDADAGSNPIVNPTTYLNTISPHPIYVRIEENANPICYGLTSFDLVVNPLPSVVNPTPLFTCDNETPDVISEFDLTLKDNEITAGDPNLTVSYFETNADAQAELNAITNPTTYTNRSVNGLPANPQTLYVVVTNTVTACVNYTTLTLNVLPNPTPNTDPSDLIQCDDNNPGDLQEVFDLTVNETYIINGQPGVTATYYSNPSDAESGSNPISNTTTYPNSSPTQTMFVRVTDDATGCYTIVNFDIIVNPTPQATPITDLIVCEDNSTGVYAFDLESKTPEILNGQDPSLFSVTFYENQSDADNLMNPLSSPYINTLGNPQQIFVAITNIVTGCSISTPSFNIEIQEIPEANSDLQPIVYTLCDNIGANDGLAQFDLTTQDINVLDGQDPSNFTVTYFSSLANANAGISPIPTIYENMTTPQTIFARVDDNSSPNSICYAITDLTLRVNLLPPFDLEDTYILCVNSNGTEVIGSPILETGLSAINYTFEWSLNGTVIAGETNSSLIPNQGGTYSVTVTDNSTLCQKTDTAEVIESAPPAVTANVTTNAFVGNDIVVANATGFGEYEYRIDFGSWQDSGTFENVSGGEHTITARDKIGCGLSSITIMVIDYPLYFTPNGDSFNDTWNVKGLENQNNVAIYIYDRFGKLLKQISASGDGWNGTFNGTLMPSSDYWFTVIYNEVGSNEHKEFSSHFSLKR